jgi:hypothetical protein
MFPAPDAPSPGCEKACGLNDCDYSTPFLNPVNSDQNLSST